MTHKPQQRRGLGRGLGSLIPTAPPSAPEQGHDGGFIGHGPGGDGAPTAGENGYPAIRPPGPADGETGRHQSEPGEQGDHPEHAEHAEHAEHPEHAEHGGQGEDHGDRGGHHGGNHGGDSAGLDETPATPGDASALTPVKGAYFAELPVQAISPNPRQPRQVFEEEAMAELVLSVQTVGLLQPVVVRRVEGDRFELIMGERRWRATQRAGLDTIPAIVRETDDDDLLRDALLENLHRAQLNPLEEAAAYQQLLDDFGCTHDVLASRIGRSRPQITNTLRLLRLSAPVQRRVAAGVLSAGHARSLLGVADADAQDRLAARVIAEGISVRGLEEIVAVGEYGGEPRTRTRPRRPTAPGLVELGSRLSDRFDTRVKVDLGKSKGKITVEFASIADLERIVAMMDPENDRAS